MDPANEVNFALEQTQSAIARERQDKWRFVMALGGLGVILGTYYYVRKHRIQSERSDKAAGKMTHADKGRLADQLMADLDLNAVTDVNNSLPMLEHLNNVEGNVNFRAGNLAKAIEAYTRALEQRTSTKGLDCAVVYANRAACYLAQHVYQYAYTDALAAVDITLNAWPKGLWRLGCALVELQDYEHALVFLGRGLQFAANEEQKALFQAKATEAKLLLEKTQEDPEAAQVARMMLCQPIREGGVTPISARVGGALKGMPIEVRDVEGKGRGVYASRRIGEGDLLLQETPVASVVLSLDSCNHCHRPKAQRVECKESKTFYCSEECKKRAWSSYQKVLSPHTEAIQQLKRAAEEYDQGLSVKIPLLAAQITAMAMQSPVWPCDPTAVAGLDHLPARYQRLPPFDRTEYSFSHVLGLYGRVEAVMGLPRDCPFLSLQWFEHLSAIICGNAFGLPHAPEADPDYHMFGPGLAIYAIAPLIQHSCKPNAEITIDTSNGGYTLSVRSNRRILKNEQITVAYVNPNLSMADRTRMLGFLDVTCRCPKCQTEARSTPTPPATPPRSPVRGNSADLDAPASSSQHESASNGGGAGAGAGAGADGAGGGGAGVGGGGKGKSRKHR